MKCVLQLVLMLTLATTIAACCCPQGQVVDVTPCPPPAEAVAVEPPPPSPKAKRILDITRDDRVASALAKKRVKGLVWEDVNLDQALAYLQAITGHKFHISPKVREEKFEDIVINAQLDDVSVADVLTVVLTEPFEMRWEVREGVVWILTNEELDGPIKLRYFDVKDLAVSIQDFRGERALADEPAAAADGPTAADVVDEIRKEVHPRYWDRENVTIEGRNGILIVRASKAVHDAIDRYLAAERRKRGTADEGNALKAKFEKTKVTLAIDSQSLGGVVRMLQITTGFNLMIDSRIVADVAKIRVDGWKLENAPLTKVLDMLVAAAGDGHVWEFRRNVAVLTHKEHVR